MTSTIEPTASSRRDLLKLGLAAGAATTIGLDGAKAAEAIGGWAGGGSRDGDVAILRFLAAAELIETDLWQQYAELAVNNPDYQEALEAIDDDLIPYTVDVTDDEQSHADFINAYLTSIGAEPADLDPFRTIESPPVKGAQNKKRLTNLTTLSVDTSYYTRYRSPKSPDFGASFPQIATIKNQPGIPTSNGIDPKTMDGIARVAAFHFPSIEQGGTSLYASLLGKISSLEVLRIAGSIYGTEAIHYAIFEDVLGGISAFDNGQGTLVVPDLTEGKHGSHHVFPKPCTFLKKSLPDCSVIRPTSTDKAGAVAAVHALTASNLFQGQSAKFFSTLTKMAEKADAAVRMVA